MTDELADLAQPAGQGEEGTGGAPYQEYLDRIPEQVRGDVEPIFKEWDANTTRRFQEHAEFRKQWEPYQESGIQKLDPEAAQWASTFYQALDNPQAIQQWYQEYAQQHGLDQAQSQPAEPEPDFSDLGGFEDPTAQFQKLLDQRFGPLTQKLDEFAQWRQTLEQGAREAQAREQIDRQLAELASKHPDRFDDNAKEALEALLPGFIEQDPRNAVSNAWSALEKILNHNEKQVLQRKASLTGGGGEPGGLPNSTPDQAPQSLDEAGKQAREAIRAMFQNR